MLKVVVPASGEEFFLAAGVYDLGRTSESDIILRHDTVSRSHAHLFFENDAWHLRDLGSTNGTFVNGQVLNGSVKLKGETRVQIGAVRLVLTPWERDDVLTGQVKTPPIQPELGESTHGLDSNQQEALKRRELFLESLTSINNRDDFYRSGLPEMLEEQGLTGFGIVIAFRKKPYVHFAHGSNPSIFLEDPRVADSLFTKEVRLAGNNGSNWVSSPSRISSQSLAVFVITRPGQYRDGLSESLMKRLVHLARYLYLVEKKTDQPDPYSTQKVFPHGAETNILYLPGMESPVLFASAASRRLVEEIRALAATKAGVILDGETGVGKEIAAAMIHHFSGRKGPFMPVMTSSLPENLVENELFGHRKGAYSGAVTTEKGKFQAAADGTLFLDEVADMPAPVQAKLLRVLENGEVFPVGATSPTKVDVRLVAASNIPFTRLVEEKRLRRDVYYRLKTFRVHIPPLRERRQEILPLFEFFISRAARESDKLFRGISPKAVRLLLNYSWPGNVRELKNEAERVALLMKSSGVVHGDMLNEEIRAGGKDAHSLPTGDSLKDRVDRLEREMITRALAETGGNRTKAADKLGLSRKGLFKKMARLGIE